LWLTIAQVAGKLASFVFVIVVARALGVREFGYFSFSISFVPLFLILGTLALDGVVVREIARDRSRVSELFASAAVIRVVLGLAGLAIAFALAPAFVAGGEAYSALTIVGSALFLDELSSLVGAVFKAYERMQYYALVVLVNRVVSTGLAVLALVLGGDLIVICLTYFAGSAGALAFGVVAMRLQFPPVHLRSATRSTITRLARLAAPLGVGGIFNTAVFRIDAVMLQAIRGPIEVGVYGVAYRFFETLLFATWALSSVALPRMARARAGAETTRTFELTAALVITFYLPIAVGSPFLAEWLVVKLFSARYVEAADIVPALTGAALLYGIAYLARMGALALDRGAPIAWIAAATLVVNVSSNAFAIPRWGFHGAAWTTLATEAFEAVLLTGLFVSTDGRPRVRRIALVPVLAAACMAGTLLAAQARDAEALLLAAAVYPVALVVVARIFARDDLRAVRGILRPEWG
jgi:O-antigen/teichoic acid export membrane protein